MKQLFFSSIIILTFCTTTSAADIATLQGGDLAIALDDTGKITAFKNTETGKDYGKGEKAPESFLMRYQGFEDKSLHQPISAKLIESKGKTKVIELTYKNGVYLTVKAESKPEYLRMELIRATPIKSIGMIEWGPINTTMRQPRARWLVMARSNNFTIGFLPLENNTVKGNIEYTTLGTKISLRSYDQTTTRNLSHEQRHVPLAVKPIPGLTVLHSSVALFGCPRGRDSELKRIEAIELTENLPHPMWQGIWIKRSKEMSRVRVWTGFDEKNVTRSIQVAKDLAAISLGRFHGYHSNWGHHDIDKRMFPGGWASLKKAAIQAKKEGIQIEFYTMTHFLKPFHEPEPYIAPVPDPRLAHLTVKTKLLSPIGANDKELILSNTPELAEYWSKHANNRVVQIDNEIIEAGSFEIQGDTIHLKKLTRGQFLGTPTKHTTKSPVRVLLVSGYHNVFPGTSDMYEEIARRQAKLICKNDLGSITLDGLGEASGHGEYEKNVYLGSMYETYLKHKNEVLVTASPSQSLLNWHMISYFSWGEFDWFAGFRGTMLDFRLSCQEKLEANLIPAKMGQYYPDEKTTLEDMEWLMARTAGWNSGVDLVFGLDRFPKNPQYDEICKQVRAWEIAKLADVFSEEQKIELRQTDRLYHLTTLPNGKVDLKFTGFWRHEGVKILPPSAIKIEAATQDSPPSVTPCGIDWSWTHDPGIYVAAGVSDDLVSPSGADGHHWKVTLPKPENKASGTKQKLQIVLRVPADAPSAIKNIQIAIGDLHLIIPAVLQPGEYLANPHKLHRAFVYGPDHHIRREVYLPQFNPYWFLPEMEKGKEYDVSFSYEPVQADAKCRAILNLAVQHNLHPKKH